MNCKLLCISDFPGGLLRASSVSCQDGGGYFAHLGQGNRFMKSQGMEPSALLCVCGTDPHLSCRGMVPQSTQEGLRQGELLGTRQGWPGPPAAARSGKVRFRGASSKKGFLALRYHTHDLLPSGGTAQNRGPPGSRCFHQQASGLEAPGRWCQCGCGWDRGAH